MKNNNLEIELKAELDEHTYNEIKRYFSKESRRPKHQINYFFDTKEKTLINSQWVFRLRKEESEYFLTVKGEASVNQAVLTRPEYEENIPEDAADKIRSGFRLKDCSFLPCQKLASIFGDLFLTPFMSFTNERIEIPWNGFTIELDKIDINGNLFFELEAETDQEKAGLLENDLKKLFAERGWKFVSSSMDKFKRALIINKIIVLNVMSSFQ
jgi:uncharacterized protein YjbK